MGFSRWEELCVARRCWLPRQASRLIRLREAIALKAFPDLELGGTASGTAVAVLTYKNRRA